MGLVSRLELKSNPFEHYTAETEPNISDYAVRPPYLSAIIDRSLALNSFTLFGERGSGKSATRITVFTTLWNEAEKPSSRTPLAVNVTDFSQVIEYFQGGRLDDRKLVELIAFHTLEKILAWLSSLDVADRDIYIQGLDPDERSLAVALLEAFYLNVPEMDRSVSTGDALKLLNSAWTTKSQIWMNARWDAISKIFATALAALSKRKIDADLDITEATEVILKSLKADSGNAARAILSKLVDLAQAFGFSGVCILIDKVDETSVTANSAEATARLVHPIFNHIQLLEVEGFSWIFFLWGNVKEHFSEKLPVRLDKIAHANITWSETGLREMIDARVEFFSNRQLKFESMLESEENADTIFSNLADIAMKSPRELIKVIDTIIREHDIIDQSRKLTSSSIDQGLNTYCVETVDAWYPETILNQVFRLGKVVFVNKDLQTKFKIGHQGARNKIIKWQESGIIIQDGTFPSDSGGKPVNRYKINDPKVLRIIQRKLLDIVGSDIEDEGDGEAEGSDYQKG